MPTFHFDVDDGTPSPDLVGHELANLREARLHAARYAADLIRDADNEVWNGHPWQVQVTDDRRRLLFSLSFMGSDAPAD